MSTIRKAARADLDAVCRIYDQIHTAEERGEAAIGWQRGVYPERETAEAALARGDLFVQEQNQSHQFPPYPLKFHQKCEAAFDYPRCNCTTEPECFGATASE